MNAKRFALTGLLAAVTFVTLVAVTLTGCSKKQGPGSFLPNAPPTVRMTAAPFDPSRSTPYFYAYRINWIGDDPDGRISFFLVRTDPDSAWRRTVKNDSIFFFTSDSSSRVTNLSTRPHIFSICAVDDGGDTSAVVSRGFYSFTQCPSVTVTNPRGNRFGPVSITPSVRITWTGNDPDGQLTTKPEYYKYILLGPGSKFPIDLALTSQYGDALRNYYAYDWEKNGLAEPWEGWTTISGDTTTVQFTNLVPESQYLFCIVGFDEAGAFTPMFDLSQNMLWLKPGFASTLGPKITMFNEFFVYNYRSGGWTINPVWEIRIEAPAGQPLTVNWSAEPPAGADMEYYQWMLDGDPTDVSIRATADDLSKWSDLSLNALSTVIGPFAGGTQHKFYVQAADNNGLISLGILSLTIVQPTWEKDLLLVSDLSMPLEQSTSPLLTPLLNWPNATELDTFLFARGNVPWQGCFTPGNSAPGIFTGYTYDVYRTRTNATDKSVLLGTLGQYKNVVWIIDSNSAVESPVDRKGLYSLRYMSTAGKLNTLAAFIRMGGRAWIVGGGGAIALSKDLGNSLSNDTYTFTYSNRLPTELQPGRFMYDIAHWRSELQVFSKDIPQIKRSSRADAIMAAGGWNAPSLQYPGGLTNPNYALLPAQMGFKTPATDPYPQSRVGRSLSQTYFYKGETFPYAMEYLSQPNTILEDVDSDPVLVRERSTLDTLMKTEAVLAQNYRAWEVGGFDQFGRIKPGSIPGTPIMTYYHGLEFPQFVFTGFDIWNYQRPQCVQLVDFVLQQIFGLAKSPAPGIAASHAVPGVPVGLAPTAGRAPVPAAKRPIVTLRPRSHE